MLDPNVIEIEVVGLPTTLLIRYLIVNLCLPFFLLLLLLLLDGFDDLLHLRVLGRVHCRGDAGPLAGPATVFISIFMISGFGPSCLHGTVQ
jgi:hypothetical protein